MKKIILILAAMLTLASCTKEGDVIYQTDLLYLETSEPLDGKGSTLYLPYYGRIRHAERSGYGAG